MRGAGLTGQEADRDLDLLAEPGAFTAALSWYRALPFAAGGGAPGPVRVPTALVWGDRDTAIDRRGVETTGRYVDAPYRLDVLVGRGHWLPQHAPEAVDAAVAWAVEQAGTAG
jgi:pimeloyl-ACP methyl ester carboxylesterase